MSGRTYIYVGAAAAILFIAAGIIYALVPRQASVFSSSDSATTTVPTISDQAISSTTPVAAGMERYFDQPHHFTLQYPDNLQASEFPGASGSLMVAFKDPTTGEGFQVFAVPYDQPKITQQTFETDEPSGVMDDPQNITVDGAPATEFYSEDQAMGDTVEVWFLNGGILYEVTTYRSLESWLLQIMQTWQFV